MAIDQEETPCAGCYEETTVATRSNIPMMRIAIAGTCGLARFIAHYIDEDTAHQVIFLSRAAQPQLRGAGYQVAVIDYSDFQSLVFALRGIDTVISTVTGPHQVKLIEAAVTVGVRRFAAAEFEGPQELRPQDDPLDRHRSLAQRYLSHYAHRLQSTIFVCGILYERFQPGGLQQSRIGLTSGFSAEGDYMLDCRRMRAQVPAYDSNNLPNVTICLTSAQDVGRFVTKAIDLQDWPAELRMCGQRAFVKDLVALVQRLKGQNFDPIRWHNPTSLRSELQVATAQQDYARVSRLRTLIATAEGQYDFSLTNGSHSLNHMFPDVRPIPFQDWFIKTWNLQA